MQRIYFDHAATTPLDKETFEKMTPYFTEAFGNADSPHFFGRKAQNGLDEARDTLAQLLNAKPSEVYFTSGGTEADNWALFGGARSKKKEGRTKVLVSAIEHHAVLAAAETLEKEGFEIVYLPVNNEGRVELNGIEKLFDEKTAIVACMAANNETGVIQPVKEIISLAKASGALSFVDAVQLAPYERIDVKALGADMVSISAHKFYGPKGVGALYINSGVKIEKFVVGGEQERGLRGGTSNLPAIVGLAHAYKKCVENMAENKQKIAVVKQAFLREMEKIDGVRLNGVSQTGVVNLRFVGVENTALLYRLDLQGVAAAAGSACASQSIKPSHVLLAMGLSESEAKESVRFSFGKDNTEEEVKLAAAIIKETVDKFAKLLGTRVPY